MFKEGIVDSFINFNDTLKTVKESFIIRLIQHDFSREEAEFALDEVEKIIQKIEQRRKFSSVFKEPSIVPEI